MNNTPSVQYEHLTYTILVPWRALILSYFFDELIKMCREKLKMVAFLYFDNFYTKYFVISGEKAGFH